MKYSYKPHGICARQINLEVDQDGRVGEVEFVGGCDGNHKGIVSLVKGMPLEEVVARLSGITCGHRHTSCPDQLAQALRTIPQQKG